MAHPASDGTKQLEQTTLGGGCFWCLEAAFQQIAGVESVVSGYAGGPEPNPTFKQVASRTTGHAEVVQVSFHPKAISYPDILDIFWTIHDPTTLNRQGNDIGPEYRSIILYETDAQKKQAAASIKAVQKLWDDPVVTELAKLERFWPAEADHQGFYAKNPNQIYCQIVINPKLAKLRKTFADRLKSD